MKKLKEIMSAGEFEIIDEWNHQWVEDLPRDEAIAKYGECEVWSTYITASSQVPDGNGEVPSWKIAVWIDIPGMKIGGWNSDNMHLRFIGDQNEATFIGKKSGQLITVTRLAYDSYQAWWRDQTDDGDDETAGYSVCGTAQDIIAEIYEEWFDDPMALEYWRKRVAENNKRKRWFE